MLRSREILEQSLTGTAKKQVRELPQLQKYPSYESY
jgi:hypothetical protein